VGGTSCSAVQDWTQEESRDSPSPIVGADPPTSPRYAAVDAVLFISCLMQEVLRQRSVARLCAGRLRRRSGGLLGAAGRRRRVGGGASRMSRSADPSARPALALLKCTRASGSVGHRAPRRGGVGVFTYRIVYIHINICLLEHSRCQLGTLRMRRDAGARPSYLKYGCRHTLLVGRC
jgi:hypothetical protein